MIIEKRTEKEYIMVDADMIAKYLVNHQHENKKRNYEDIPDLKCFDFLRKGFEENPWRNVKCFSTFDEPDIIYKVEEFYYDYMLDGYVIMMKYSDGKNKNIVCVHNVSMINCDIEILKIEKMKMISTF